MKSQTDIIWSAILNIMQLSHFCSSVCLFSCLNPFHHFSPTSSISLFLLPLLSAFSPSVITSDHSLILSHFQSVPSPLHSHLSVLIQINFPRPAFLCIHLSNLITLLSCRTPLVFFFSHDISPCFAVCVSV